MKRKYLALLFLIVILGIPAYAQYNSPCFKLTSSATGQRSFENLILTKDTIINLNTSQFIYGLTISGNSRLSDDESFVRITLKDGQGHEYLVYENYSLLADALDSNFNGVGIETVLLNGVSAHSLKIRVEKANLRLDAFQYNTVALSNYSCRVADLRSVQVATVVDKLNQHLKDRNMTWRAGVTSIAEMTYEKKQQTFGEEMPYMGGWEYYIGGIFVMPGYRPDSFAATSTASTAPTYVKEFDWRNRHGKNWMTPAKEQPGYTCWTFAPIGVTEAYTNLYYNKNLDYDLSEQELISCSLPNPFDPWDKRGGSVANSLFYIESRGIVDEFCFPLKLVKDECENKCSNPSERISVKRWGSINTTDEKLKTTLFRCPIVFSIFKKDYGHSVVLSGYKMIEAGDKIFINMHPDEDVGITVDSPLIGATAWLIKNSAGSRWGIQGYGYIVTNWTTSLSANVPSGKVTSLIYTDEDIVCEDNDGDGYYFWGIGDKPSSLPSWVPDEPDGDDSNADMGPMDSYGNLKDLNPNRLFPQIINMFTSWHYDNYIHTHLIIANGGNLIISGNISMYKDAKITVQSGGYLEIDGGKVKNANVIVDSGGYLKIRNGGILQKGSGDEFTAQKGAIIDFEYGGIE